MGARMVARRPSGEKQFLDDLFFCDARRHAAGAPGSLARDERSCAMCPDMDWGKSLYGEREATARPALVDGGILVGRVLRDLGVQYLFAINGGHTFPILGALRENGIT